ncbi:hypothetical protein MKX01_038816, partial [Papaver californicum]
MVSHQRELFLQLIGHIIRVSKKSKGELLLSYAFVPREGTNPSDSVELLLSLGKFDECYGEKIEALRRHGC